MKKTAFTLVEIMIAVFIIGAGVVPVMSLFLSGTQSVEKGGIMLEASIAAQNIIDRAKSDSFLWNHIPFTTTIPSSDFPQFTIPKRLLEKYKATAELSIELAPEHTVLSTGANETNIVQIMVVMNWTEKGRATSFRLLTYRANTNALNLKTSSRFL